MAWKRLLAVARSPVVGEARRQLLSGVAAAIEPINVAGLADAKRRNWYPALAEDLIAAAPKLGADRAAIDRLLTRCGFTADPTARTDPTDENNPRLRPERLDKPLRACQESPP